MKEKFRVCILVMISLTFSYSGLNAQDKACVVLLKSISDKYEGDCKKGLAHGQGIAIGIDRYEGHFKKGLPHGKGTYQYNDGAVYKGGWHKGLRNGQGEYTFVIDGRDSVVTGYWKDDKYIGKTKNQKEYQITLRRGIETFSFQKLNETDNWVEIYFERNAKRYTPSDLRLTSSSGYQTTHGNNVVVEDLKYPFTGTIRYSVLNKLGTSRVNCELEYTIQKPGKWQIILRN